MIGFDPEDYYKAERMEMRRKRKAAGPLAWLQNLLAPITGSDGTIAIPTGVLPDLAGDVTGPPAANTVEAIRGVEVSATPPTTGQVLTAIDADSAEWDDPTSGAALTVQELDGAPLDSAVTIIRVTNGKLVDNGAGDVTLDLSGTPLTVQEVDGSPTETPTTTLEFPNGTLTEPGAGVVRYTPAIATAAPVDATYVTRTANATLTNEVLLGAVLASELQTRWEPLTNGDWGAPDLIFFEGNVIMVEVAN